MLSWKNNRFGLIPSEKSKSPCPHQTEKQICDFYLFQNATSTPILVEAAFSYII